MASPSVFSSYPPFPSDVPTAPLARISLSKLLTGDTDEEKALFQASHTLGFFLLDLSGSPLGESLIKDVDNVLRITHNTMDLPTDAKMPYHAAPPGRLFGYKALGYTKTETKQPDRCEFFMLAQDELSGLTTIPEPGYPPPIAENMKVFHSFLENGQPIVELVCKVLSRSLGLPKDALYSKQKPSERSGTMIRLIKYPGVKGDDDRRTSLVQHTDMGTLTLLVNVLGGLQIPKPTSDANDGDRDEEWLYVRPEPNHLIVNIGDALVQFSGGVLRSSVHRVTYPPGKQADLDRYSVAYLVRAGADVTMKRIKGGWVPDGDEEENITASEWEKKKNMALIQGKDCVRSTGGEKMKEEK
jgi:isopenicillin N synthase-like dioxygenase